MSWHQCADCGVGYARPAGGNSWYCSPCFEALAKKDPAHPFVRFMDPNLRRAILRQLDGHDQAKVRDHLELVTENVYARLPSGDYGRGDVRKVIEAWLA